MDEICDLFWSSMSGDGVAAGISPVTHGSGLYTHAMKTEALKQALTKYGFDAA